MQLGQFEPQYPTITGLRLRVPKRSLSVNWGSFLCKIGNDAIFIRHFSWIQQYAWESLETAVGVTDVSFLWAWVSRRRSFGVKSCIVTRISENDPVFCRDARVLPESSASWQLSEIPLSLHGFSASQYSPVSKLNSGCKPCLNLP